MKSSILLLIGILAVPASADAQMAQATIERALAAAPARARDGASVVRWNSDHSYEFLKEGDNNIVCYDRSGEPGQRPFAVQCTNLGNLDRVSQNRRFAAETSSREELNAMLDKAEENGTRVLPEFGSVWLTMSGDDQQSARFHRTIAVPGATAASTGLPESPGEGGAWIMAAGTSTAHIMIPGT
jgi:hypothetical protein